MSRRSTPQEAFDAARSAMERQDWDAFYACLDPADVRRVVKNGLNRPGRDPELETIFVEAGVGSISSSLFVGDTLEGVTVDANLARGTRRAGNGATESIGFVQREGEWQVRLFAR
jgi:hypothetical protein